VECELDALFDYSYNIYMFLFVKVTVNSDSKISVAHWSSSLYL